MTVPDDSLSSKRAAMRSTLRALRRRLPERQRRRYAQRVASRLARLPAFSRARWIAGYLPFDGELDPLPAMQSASAAGKNLCLPIIDPRRRGTMTFGHFRSGSVLLMNRFGILEPCRRMTGRVPLRQVDMMLMPLVGFDDQGNRLGMGAGYYDRLLHRRTRCQWRRPLLVGIAFELQRVEHIPRESWDVPMDLIITDRRIYRPRQTHTD